MRVSGPGLAKTRRRLNAFTGAPRAVVRACGAADAGLGQTGPDNLEKHSLLSI